MTGTAMHVSVLLFSSALLLSAVKAGPQDNGPQTFEATQSQPEYAQRYKEVIMYLTPTQIKNYEAGRGLPDLSKAPLTYEQQTQPQAPTFAFEQDRERQPPTFIYEQKKPEQETRIINEEERQIIQSTLDILEANKMQFQHAQQNNPNIEITKAEVDQNADIRPIEEQNTEKEELKQQQQQQEQNKLIEQANKEQEQLAKSYAYFHLFSNQKPDNALKIQIFHPEPHSVNLDEEIRQQKENSFEIQRDPLLRQKYKLIPYEYIAEENIHQKVRDDLIRQEEKQAEKQAQQQLLISIKKDQEKKQAQQQFLIPFKQEEKPAQHQLFIPASEQLQSIKEISNIQNEYQQQYAPQFTSPSNNIDLAKIIQEIQLEREAAKIHADNIAKSPPVVIHNDVSIIKRRPVHVINHVNIPYPAPFFVPVTKTVEVKVPQPYAVPIEIIRHVPVPVVKTETVEVEKPVPYEVEKHVPEYVEKKVYVPVEKPYTVERVVPVEIKKEVPVEVPIHKPEKFTIIRHVWKHRSLL